MRFLWFISNLNGIKLIIKTLTSGIIVKNKSKINIRILFHTHKK